MKKILSLSLALLILMSFAGCGSSAKTSEYSVSEPSYAAGSYAAAAADSYAYEEAADYGFSASNAAEAPAAGTASDTPNDNPEKIIYSANVTLESTEFDNALNGINAIVKEYGGYVESSSITNSNYYNQSRGKSYNRGASFTIRVPSARFSDIMNNLQTLGNVPHSYTYTENVTSQYYDTQARLTAYTTQEKALLELMEKAESVEDIITIQSHLTEIRYSIESLQSTLNNWDRRVSYSTIYLDLDEVQEYTPEKEPSFGEKLADSAKSGMKAAVSFVKEAILFILEAGPTFIIWAAIIWGVVAVIRRLLAKRRAAGKTQKERKKLFGNKKKYSETVTPQPEEIENNKTDTKE